MVCFRNYPLSLVFTVKRGILKSGVVLAVDKTITIYCSPISVSGKAGIIMIHGIGGLDSSNGPMIKE